MKRVVIQSRPPDVDIERRVLRGVVVATRSLASDGFILEPMGIELADFQRDPQVRALHGPPTFSAQAPVIARALVLEPSRAELVAEVQFADTTLGREYAYLYGVNEKREVFMRAWSVNAQIIERRTLGLAEARRLLGDLFDEEMAERVTRAGAAIGHATRSRMVEFSAVLKGADRNALTRAFGGGVATAGTILAELDMQEAIERIEVLKRTQDEAAERLSKLEEELLALRRDGAAAAARGDTAGILSELKRLAEAIR